MQSVDLSSLVPPLSSLSIGATVTGDTLVDWNMTRAARSASESRFLPFQVYNTIGTSILLEQPQFIPSSY